MIMINAFCEMNLGFRGNAAGCTVQGAQFSVSISRCRDEGSGFRVQGSRIPSYVKQFRRGLVFKAHRLVYHSTLGSREIKKKKDPLCALFLVLGVSVGFGFRG